MTRPMTIDIVSDVTCPWCIIGLRGLEMAIERVGDVADVQLRFHPFELNPDMPPEGQNIVEHMGEKYGSTPQTAAEGRATITAKAAEVGFTMAMTENSRAWNTFDAHRLLQWAALEGRQHPLKLALFEAYFTDNKSPADHDVLVAAAVQAGLDAEAARAVLASDRYAQDVRQEEMLWQSRGIQAVPAIIFEGKYLVSGAQPPETFEQVIREIAKQAA